MATHWNGGEPSIAPLTALFEREGFARVEPPVLQPSAPFIDLSGEDIRRRIFVTQDASGAELCLRPEYTIPVCRAHLAAGAASPAAYAYAGPVFRLRAGESGEFAQAGIESIGRDDPPAADADILALGLEGLAALGLPPPRVTLGDVGLLDALLTSLDLSPPARRRTLRAVVSGRGLGGPEAPVPAAEHAGLLAAIEGQEPAAARALVEDVLAIAGIVSVGGRSAADIAARFLARAGEGAPGGLDEGARAVLERYLAIAGDPDSAASDLRGLAADSALDLGEALDAFEARIGFMAARGLDVGSFRFAAGFARNLDYYTGFIFELHGRGDKPLVGGGRYDRLLGQLGAPEPVAAVGCSFWLDRIAREAQA